VFQHMFIAIKRHEDNPGHEGADGPEGAAFDSALFCVFVDEDG